ncbi:unnamed protein product [Fraxinus pennsylvanica]|uniref:2'-phosphotransferase n=1 Tax=Fraxinus pennsylvanica TaxID=56036 RepID=A0AAD2DZK9_9LAMI|nr:unnamed protein product [Fraxinus pennsylvanica]
MDGWNKNASFTASAGSSRSGGGRGRGLEKNDCRERSRGQGGGGVSSGKDKIDALGRLLTRILQHMAFELKLDIRNDGYVKVQDMLKLNLKTLADIPLRSYTVDDVREAVRKDNKQRFSLLEENGELLIRANQGHTIATVETESLLKPILSPEEVPVCVHGTYKKNLESILEHGLKRMNRLHVHFSCGLPTDGEVISGMRRDVNLLIFLDVRKALEEGMKLYISDNRVILTEGFNGVVPIKLRNRPLFVLFIPCSLSPFAASVHACMILLHHESSFNLSLISFNFRSLNKTLASTSNGFLTLSCSAKCKDTIKLRECKFQSSKIAELFLLYTTDHVLS